LQFDKDTAVEVVDGGGGHGRAFGGLFCDAGILPVCVLTMPIS